MRDRVGGLAKRDLRPEIMDQPGLDVGLHRQALEGLARINAVSLTASRVWATIVAERVVGPEVRMLDLACGGGDVTIGVWRRAQRAGIGLRITGIDRSDVAVDHARARAARDGAAVRFERGDVCNDPLPSGYDVVMSSLFLHHLDVDTAVAVLRRMAGASRDLVLVDDLVRSRGGLALARLGTRLLSRSDVVHSDGPSSVLAAFTPSELKELAIRAGLRRRRVQLCWPARMMLTARVT